MIFYQSILFVELPWNYQLGIKYRLVIIMVLGNKSCELYLLYIDRDHGSIIESFEDNC